VLCDFLTMNSADLHTKIGITMPKIIELLSDDDWNVREASISALSKFVEHSKAALLCYAIC